jgi:hypothetical protein
VELHLPAVPSISHNPPVLNRKLTSITRPDTPEKENDVTKTQCNSIYSDSRYEKSLKKNFYTKNEPDSIKVTTDESDDDE